MSYLSSHFHIVYSTKDRVPSIPVQAVLRCLLCNSTLPSTWRKVKLLAQVAHSQKFSIALCFS